MRGRGRPSLSFFDIYNWLSILNEGEVGNMKVGKAIKGIGLGILAAVAIGVIGEMLHIHIGIRAVLVVFVGGYILSKYFVTKEGGE